MTTTEDNGSGTMAAIAAGIATAKPTQIGTQDDDGRVTSDFPAALAFLKPEGAEIEVVDLIATLADHREHPVRKVGTFRVHDADTFIDYLTKHGLSHESEVWADAVGKSVVGVINGHQGTTLDGMHDYAGWGDHRVTYEVTYTDAWKAWAEFDKKLMDQSDFAELIEMRMVDIATPTAADMLELAQSFNATIGVTFQSSKVLSSGERQLTYKEDVSSTAGRSGQLEIPKEFHLGLTPFEGSESYDVTARFRFRIDNGSLRLGYVLVRPEDILRDAFKDVVNAIRTGIAGIDGTASAIPVFRGIPAAPL